MRIITSILTLSLIFSGAHGKKDESNVASIVSRLLISATKAGPSGSKSYHGTKSQQGNDSSSKTLSNLITKKRQNLASSTQKKRSVLKTLSKGPFKVSTIAKTFLKSRSLGRSLGLLKRGLEPSWGDEYKEMADSAVDLFEDFVADGSFSFDEFISPPEFCSADSVSEESVCTDSIRAMMEMGKRVLRNPWTVLDMGMFMFSNLSLLPWDHILDYEKLRVFLNSIPKNDLYEALVDEIHSLLSEFVSEDYMSYLPEIYYTVYKEIIVNLAGLDSPVEFDEVLSSVLGGSYYDDDYPSYAYDDTIDNHFGDDANAAIDDHFGDDANAAIDDHFEDDFDDDIVAVIDEVHQEICYLLSLESVKIDFKSGGACATDKLDSRDIAKVPFCVSKDFLAEHNGKEFFEEDYYVPAEFDGNSYQCPLIVQFSETYDLSDWAFDDTEEVELPINSFFAWESNKGGEPKSVFKDCKWLKNRPLEKRQQHCAKASSGYATASEACPSTCCHHSEDGSNIWLKKKARYNADGVMKSEVSKDCDWLKGQSLDDITKYCKKNAFSESSVPAYVACPETCGLCAPA